MKFHFNSDGPSGSLEGPVPSELPLGPAGTAVLQHDTAVAGGYVGPPGFDGQPGIISYHKKK